MKIRALLLHLLYLPIALQACWAESIKVKIVADDDYPPYSYVENGHLKGLYIDLISKASQQLLPEYEVSLEAMPWKRALMKLEQGEEFAILPPYKHESKRPYIGPYSLSLYTEKVVVYCRKDISLESAFSGVEKPIKSISLGINAGYLLLNKKYQNAVDNEAIKLHPNKSTEANLLKMVLGRIDCYINDEMTIKKGLQQIFEDDETGEIAQYELKELISKNTAHIGYTKSHTELYPYKEDFIIKMNNALDTILANGYIEEYLK